MTSSAERRRHVRVRPIADLPASAVIATNSLMREMLPVLDISLGGLALAQPGPEVAAVGNTVKLVLTLATHGEHTVGAAVRWMSPHAMGVEIVDAPDAAQHAIRRYVAELQERGSSV